MESSVTLGAPEGTQSQPVDDSALTSIRAMRTYQVKDENSPGGKSEIERDELAKGYEYGRTAVHISETDENITTLETLAAMELVGFIQSDKVCLVKMNAF